MSTEKMYVVSSDTGLSGRISSPRNLLSASQETLRQCLADYGDYIYGAGGSMVAQERREHWEPKLRAAKVFSVEITETRK